MDQQHEPQTLAIDNEFVERALGAYTPTPLSLQLDHERSPNNGHVHCAFDTVCQQMHPAAKQLDDRTVQIEPLPKPLPPIAPMSEVSKPQMMNSKTYRRRTFRPPTVRGPFKECGLSRVLCARPTHSGRQAA